MRKPEHTPVLVGIGVTTRREARHEDALEPMDLMLEAVRKAGADCGASQALAGVQQVAVPRGRWTYANPPGEIARTIGASGARTVLSTVGVLQQTLLGDACERIARGEIHSALIAGADAGYRILRAQIAGQRANERAQHDEPDELLAPKEELRHSVERRAGMKMPVGLYAILESAWRASQGWSVPEHRDRLATLWERFSRVAVDNPHAWNRSLVPAAQIREASERNPMQAFPYTRHHCSTWNVDQASALLLCSEARADELGIAAHRRVYALASTESNHMVAVSARAQLHACPGAAITGQSALAAAGLNAGDLDLVDFYSCFPIAIQTYAAALGLSLERPLTVTGGMPFAGGPYNNYVLQSTCRTAELLRAGRGRHALVSSVSGVLTKQGFGLWSSQRPARPFVNLDLSDSVAREVAVKEVLDTHTGDARVAGYTVLYGRDQAPRGVMLLDTPQGARAMATSEDPALVARMSADEEFIGRTVRVNGHEIVA